MESSFMDASPSHPFPPFVAPSIASRESLKVLAALSFLFFISLPHDIIRLASLCSDWALLNFLVLVTRSMKHWSVVLPEFFRMDFLPFPFPFLFLDFFDFFLPFPFLDLFAFFLFFASLASLSRRDSPASDNVFSELTRLLDSCVAEASWKMQRRARARTAFMVMLVMLVLVL